MIYLLMLSGLRLKSYFISYLAVCYTSWWKVPVGRFCYWLEETRMHLEIMLYNLKKWAKGIVQSVF